MDLVHNWTNTLYLIGGLSGLLSIIIFIIWGIIKVVGRGIDKRRQEKLDNYMWRLNKFYNQEKWR